MLATIKVIQLQHEKQVESFIVKQTFFNGSVFQAKILQRIELWIRKFCWIFIKIFSEASYFESRFL